MPLNLRARIKRLMNEQADEAVQPFSYAVLKSTGEDQEEVEAPGEQEGELPEVLDVAPPESPPEPEPEAVEAPPEDVAPPEVAPTPEPEPDEVSPPEDWGVPEDDIEPAAEVEPMPEIESAEDETEQQPDPEWNESQMNFDTEEPPEQPDDPYGRAMADTEWRMALQQREQSLT
jgi:hypothetical protein